MYALGCIDLSLLDKVGTVYSRSIGRDVHDLSDKQKSVIKYWLRWLTTPSDLEILLPKLSQRDLQLLAKIAVRVTTLHAKSDWDPSATSVAHMVNVVERIHAFRADRAIALIKKKEDISLIEHHAE